jgi:hypothetical protein
MIRLRVIGEHRHDDVFRVVCLLTDGDGFSVLTHADVYLASDADPRFARDLAVLQIQDSIARAAVGHGR